ncbi:MAG: GFA family protein [Acidimicrobiales bacterium]
MTSKTCAPSDQVRARGRCLCGAVSYEVHGPLRPILICHCADCRRWHGYACATTAAYTKDVVISDSGLLSWYKKPSREKLPSRGFCAQCGSSLFWKAPERNTISIAAGTLDPPSGLRVVARIFVADASDYEVITDDGLAHFAQGAPPEIAALSTELPRR